MLVWIVIILTFGVGIFSFTNISRFEDPEFTIRQAVIITPYPGATPEEVAREITQPLERAIGQMQEIKEIVSTSSAGQSRIEVEVKYKFSGTKDKLQLVWGKLRDRVNDGARGLPPNAGTSIVLDDFGDVYGLFYIVTGEGYSAAELNDYAEEVQRSLYGLKDVGKVVLTGQQTEAVFVEISREKVAALGGSVQSVYKDLATQNTVVSSGTVRIGDQRVVINPTGNIESIRQLTNLPVSIGASGTIVRLGEIADISRGYVEPPSQIFRYNGKTAIGIGISNARGSNVVEVGKRVEARLAEMEVTGPLGIEIHEFYHQGNIVSEAITAFAVNVFSALAIVLLTLWVFMGWRSAVIIGFILLLTVSATLAVMFLLNIPMHRISLGALIIALGMMVDNAIVIVEGILVGVRNGQKRLSIAKDTVSQMIWPLLGGSVIGILAFAPIGLAPGRVAEYTNHLFWVIMISLFFSWFFAISIAPYLCNWFFRSEEKRSQDKHANVQNTGVAAKAYRGFLALAIRFRWGVIAATILVFAASVFGFKYVGQGFFPAATTPIIMVDYRLPSGTDIERTSEDLRKIETKLSEFEGVTDIQTMVGGGTLRFRLVYQPEAPDSGFGQLLLRVNDSKLNADLQRQIQAFLTENYPEAQVKTWLFKLGPGGGSSIEAEFSGRDMDNLYSLADQAKMILRDDPYTIMVKDDWGSPVPVIQPLYSESRGRKLGITRESLASALQSSFSGRPIGLYREGDNLIPIIARSPQSESKEAQRIEMIQVLNAKGNPIPLLEVVDGFETEWRYPSLTRVNQKWVINAQADPSSSSSTTDVLDRVGGKIENIQLPTGYSFKWDGEKGDRDEAVNSLLSVIPVSVLAMVLVVIILFNTLRHPFIIWMIVPLALIGVVLGLLIMRTPLEFIAILGLLSLSGLLIKNAIVIVDQINLEIRSGKPRLDAILDASFNRARPVILGSLTTVLGVVPLFFDAFFKSMSVVLVFGLSFGTLLTLVVLPVFYAASFGVRTTETQALAEGEITT